MEPQMSASALGPSDIKELHPLVLQLANADVEFRVKYRGQIYVLPRLSLESTVAELRDLIYVATDVRVDRQKIIGLSKSALCKMEDSYLLKDVDLKLKASSICSVTLMGSPDSEMLTVGTTSSDSSPGKEILNDLSLEYGPGTQIFAKLSKHAAACEIHLMHAPRAGKKLLVLDLDHTLLDFSSSKDSASSESELQRMKRPYMDFFLSLVYREYDLAIWSQTSWRWLEVKLVELGLATHSDYKISFCLDKTTMFRASEAHDLYVKPLALIFTKAPPGAIWGVHNTLHVDDLVRNFELNKRSGVLVSPWSRDIDRGQKSHRSSSAGVLSTPPSEVSSPQDDIELALLASYLVKVASLPDVSSKDHANWRAETMVEMQEKMKSLPPK